MLNFDLNKMNGLPRGSTILRHILYIHVHALIINTWPHSLVVIHIRCLVFSTKDVEVLFEKF